MKCILSIIFLFSTFLLIAQINKNKTDTINGNEIDLNIVELDEVIISANRWGQITKNKPQKITLISNSANQIIQAQTTANLIESSGDVFIQKSQMGGGSPMIRGFSANAILLVIDGIRINNAIYRSGNLHNLIQIDPFSLNSTEIIFGPNSLIYGSDALGGVINFKTSKTGYIISDTLILNGEATVRTSSANKEKTVNIKTLISKKQWSILSNVTYSQFNDLLMGKNGNKHNYLRNHYIKRIDNKDSTFVNKNPYLQVHTGYKQLNVLEKIEYKINSSNTLSYTFILSDIGAIPRYDRLLIYKNPTQLKFAEWYYGPQNWLLNSLRYSNQNKNIFYNKFDLIFTYQKYKESRHSRQFNKNEQLNQFENVSIYSLNADFEKEQNKLVINYGFDYYFNNVVSIANYYNILTNEKTNTISRYPDGKNHYHSTSLYASSQYKVKENLLLLFGLRYNYIKLISYLKNNYLSLPITNFNLNTYSITPSIGSIYYNNKTNSHFTLYLGSGFRAPNIDDIGKVFDSQPGAVIIPNKNLKSEYAYNIDMSYSQVFFKNIKTNLTFFYTYVDNIMVRRPSNLNGNDSILYNGELSRVYIETNANNANIYGLTIQLSAKIYTNIYLKQTYTLIKGKDSDDLPIRHVSPSFGTTCFELKFKKIHSELYAHYNNKLPFNKLAESERDKSEIYAIDKNGNPYSPGWWTINLRIKYIINKHFTTVFGIDNITNNLYRPYSSGVVASGRNYIISVQSNF